MYSVEIVVDDETEAEQNHDGTCDESAADEAGTAESTVHSMDTHVERYRMHCLLLSQAPQLS